MLWDSHTPLCEGLSAEPVSSAQDSGWPQRLSLFSVSLGKPQAQACPGLGTFSPWTGGMGGQVISSCKCCGAVSSRKPGTRGCVWRQVPGALCLVPGPPAPHLGGPHSTPSAEPAW